MKRLALLFAALVACLATPAAAAAPAAPGELSFSFEGFVSDGAEVLSAPFVDEIKRRLATIHDQGVITVMVVTMPALDGADTAEVASAIGQQFEQAAKTNKDWAVLLLAPVDREMSVAFRSSNQDAAEALKSLDDASREQWIQELGDAFYGAVTPFFQVSDWEGGLRAGVDAMEGRLERDRTPPPLNGTPSAKDGVS